MPTATMRACAGQGSAVNALLAVIYGLIVSPRGVVVPPANSPRSATDRSFTGARSWEWQSRSWWSSTRLVPTAIIFWGAPCSWSSREGGLPCSAARQLHPRLPCTAALLCDLVLLRVPLLHILRQRLPPHIQWVRPPARPCHTVRCLPRARPPCPTCCPRSRQPHSPMPSVGLLCLPAGSTRAPTCLWFAALPFSLASSVSRSPCCPCSLLLRCAPGQLPALILHSRRARQAAVSAGAAAPPLTDCGCARPQAWVCRSVDDLALWSWVLLH